MEQGLNFSNSEGWEAMQRQLEEAVELSHRSLKRYEHKLPPVLYHITTRQNAERILQDGLSPSRRMEGDNEVVSLTDEIAFGKRVATETQRPETPEELVVLQIDTSKLNRELAESFLEERNRDVLPPALQEKLKTENPKALEEYLHEVHYEEKIPTDAISRHHEGVDPNADWHRQRREHDVVREIAEEEQ